MVALGLLAGAWVFGARARGPRPRGRVEPRLDRRDRGPRRREAPLDDRAPRRGAGPRPAHEPRRPELVRRARRRRRRRAGGRPRPPLARHPAARRRRAGRGRRPGARPRRLLPRRRRLRPADLAAVGRRVPARPAADHGAGPSHAAVRGRVPRRARRGCSCDGAGKGCPIARSWRATACSPAPSASCSSSCASTCRVAGGLTVAQYASLALARGGRCVLLLAGAREAVRAPAR